MKLFRVPSRRRERLQRRWLAALLTCGSAALATLPGRATEPAVPDPLPDAEARSLSVLQRLVLQRVDGVSKYAQYALDAPASVTVIGAGEIAAHGHDTLAEVLGLVPGLYASTDRAYTSLGVRGFSPPGDYNARTLMLVDGLRINEAIYDQALPGTEFPLVAEWIKRLEFVSGPASSVYGANALFGTAQVVTLDGADRPGTRLELGAGSNGLRRAVASHGATLAHGEDLFVGLAALRSRGETLRLDAFDSPEHPGGRVEGLDGTEYAALLAKYRDGPLQARLHASHRLKQLPTAPYGTAFARAGTSYRDAMALASLAWDDGPQGPWHPQWRLALAGYRFDGRYVFDAPGGLLLNRDVAHAAWAEAEYRGTWRGWINHTVVAGVEGRRVLRAVQRNFDVEPAATYLEDRRRPQSLGLFVQDQFRLSERWSLTSGLRLDTAPGAAAETSPRLALVWRPHAQQSWKLLAGRAFRRPNLYELHYQDGGISQQPNPALRSERITTLELAAEQALDDDTRLAARIYRYRLRDLIELTAIDDALFQFRNVASAQTRGLEFELERRARGAQLRASLALQQARLGDGTRPGNSPRWVFKAAASRPLGLQWRAALELQGLGNRFAATTRLPSQWLAHAALQRRLGEGQELALRLRNLADARHDAPATPGLAQPVIQQPRRSVELSWSTVL